MAFGDVCLIFGTLLSVGIALPGLLVTWALLLPGVAGRARLRLERTPGRCLGLGLGWLALSLIPLRLLFTIPGLGVALGWLGSGALLTIASIGAAGLAMLMGDRLRQGGTPASPHGATLRGAVALELAAAFPLLGWFIVLPVVSLLVLGAAGFALLRWSPRPAALPPLPSLTIAQPSQSLPPTPTLGVPQVPTGPVAWPEAGVGRGLHTS
ncbi:MAG TPA: hypothetical protein VFW96_07995 [Thermomicrobiales bacterium]|nr:hypothetical protein [Thermomicrobiales bacterium]